MALFFHDNKAIPEDHKYKDPDSDAIDYLVNWATWLGADTISTATWLIDGVESTSVNGLEITSTSNTTTAATVWLKGGTEHSTYTITSRITTAGGRDKIDRSFLLTIKQM